MIYAKKKLEYQEVEIKDILTRLLNDCENGDLMTASGRTFANVEGGNGRMYSFAIVATCDDDDFYHNYEIPIVDPDSIRAGKGVIRAPSQHLHSSKKLKESELIFPEPDDY